MKGTPKMMGNEIGRACSTLGAGEKFIQVLFSWKTWREDTTFHTKEVDYRNCVGSWRLDSSGSGQVPVVGSCEHGDETSGSIKCGVFVEYMSDY